MYIDYDFSSNDKSIWYDFDIKLTFIGHKSVEFVTTHTTNEPFVHKQLPTTNAEIIHNNFFIIYL